MIAMLNRLFYHRIVRASLWLVCILICLYLIVSVSARWFYIPYVKDRILDQKITIRQEIVKSHQDELQTCKESLDKHDERALRQYHEHILPKNTRLIKHLNHYLDAEYVPPLLLPSILLDTSCPGICKMYVYYGEDKQEVSGIMLELREQEKVIIEAPYHFKGFYPNFCYDRVAVFFFFKQESENCLKRILPEGLLDYKKEKNVVPLTDEAFDYLMCGEAKLSLILDDNSLMGNEKIVVLSRHQRDGKFCDCDHNEYDKVSFDTL